ncbi:MAG: hypothetical protein VB119_02945 [Candidatus Metalachnospira sp.]|nr:hypothetical protein [Candidatus Metalachnospira sp.]
MSIPASAHYLIAERGTINNQKVTVERTEQEIIKLATEDHILDTMTENGLDLKQAVTAEDLASMLWDLYRRPDANGVVAINSYKADRYAVQAVKWSVGKCIMLKSADPKAALTSADIYAYIAAVGLDISRISKVPENPTRFDAVKAIIEALYNDTVLDYDRTGIMDTEESHHEPHDPYPPVPPMPC